MKAFFVQNDQDMRTFRDEVIKKQGLRVNLMCCPKKKLSDFVPDEPISRVSHFGFTEYLIDVFDAPDPLKAYLCSKSSLHKIPIGNERPSQLSEKIFRETKIQKFYSGKRCYTSKISRYSKEATVIAYQVRGAIVLTGTIDPEEKKNLEDKIMDLKDQLSSVSEERAVMDRREQELRAKNVPLEKKKKEISEKQKEIKLLRGKLKRKLDCLEDLRKNPIDVDGLIAACHKKLTALTKKKIKELKELFKTDEKRAELVQNRTILMLAHFEAIEKKKKLESAISEGSGDIERIEVQLREVAELTDRFKKEAADSLREAQSTCGIPNSDLPPSLVTAFDLLPSTLDELDQKIRDLEASAAANNATDGTVLQRFADRSRTVKDLEKDLDDLERKHGNFDNNIETLRSSWLGELNRLVERITENFSKSFQKINCVGEVRLDTDHSSYDDYGIDIWVKFREAEAMSKLTAHQQSGGERSVSTILYLMAMQEISVSPFRVVDEVNQGMDPRNERSVFSQIVDIACRPNTSQYFLITPKLLPDLEYNDKMKIHCVHNGHWLCDHTEWNLNDFLKTKRALVEA